MKLLLPLLGASAALSLPACAPKTAPTMAPMPATEEKPQDTTYAKPDALDGLVSSLSERAQGLPGRTADAHRSAMHDVFDNLAQLLPALAGPDQSGGFRQEVRSIETARDRLASDAGDVNAEPAIDTGLRAASTAFADVAKSDDTFAAAEISANIEKLMSTVDELDNVRAVGRPYVAADAVQLMAQVAQQMSERLAAPSGEASTASSTTAPATTEPAASRASEPASKESAATEPAPPAAEKPAPIEPKPAEAKAEGEKAPAPEPAPAAPAEPAPAPAAEPNK